MSLVEAALKKMRGTQRAAPRPAESRVIGRPHTQVFGKVIHATEPGRVVSINQAALRAAGLLPPEHQERVIAQQYRQIKRPLIANATGRGGERVPNGHLVMMASAMPGDGKTFTALNLAFSMAREKDLRVLLVDADVAKPHLSHMFGLAEQPGLLDVLRNPRVDPESMILATSVPGLFVLPAGKRSENATELLASDRMQDVARRIGGRDMERMVLFDSPPLLLTTESQALAQIAGQIVVIVRADVTSQQVLLDALRHVAGRPCVSLVLNQSASASPTGYYYYAGGEDREGGSE